MSYHKFLNELNALNEECNRQLDPALLLKNCDEINAYGWMWERHCNHDVEINRKQLQVLSIWCARHTGNKFVWDLEKLIRLHFILLLKEQLEKGFKALVGKTTLRWTIYAEKRQAIWDLHAPRVSQSITNLAFLLNQNWNTEEVVIIQLWKRFFPQLTNPRDWKDWQKRNGSCKRKICSGSWNGPGV